MHAFYRKLHQIFKTTAKLLILRCRTLSQNHFQTRFIYIYLQRLSTEHYWLAHVMLWMTVMSVSLSVLQCPTNWLQEESRTNLVQLQRCVSAEELRTSLTFLQKGFRERGLRHWSVTGHWHYCTLKQVFVLGTSFLSQKVCVCVCLHLHMYKRASEKEREKERGMGKKEE